MRQGGFIEAQLLTNPVKVPLQGFKLTHEVHQQAAGLVVQHFGLWHEVAVFVITVRGREFVEYYKVFETPVTEKISAVKCDHIAHTRVR